MIVGKAMGVGRWSRECLRTLILNRVELGSYNKGHLYISNKRQEAYSTHSQASNKELLQKSYHIKEVGGS